MDEYKLEQFLYENPEFIEEGLKVIDRQRKVETGIIDLLGKDKSGKYIIIEIKIDPEHDSVSQIAKYIIGLMKEGIPKAQMRGMLVARSISRDIKELCDFFNIETKELALGKHRDTHKETTKPAPNTKEEAYYSDLVKQEGFQGELPPVPDQHNHLSYTENTIVKTILTFNKNNQYATYQDISKSMKITKGCVRGYISSIMTKGIPIHKKKLKTNQILLYIKEEKN